MSEQTQRYSKCGSVYPLPRENFGQTSQKTRKVTFRRVCRASVQANTARHHAEASEKVLARVARRKEQDLEAEG